MIPEIQVCKYIHQLFVMTSILRYEFQVTMTGLSFESGFMISMCVAYAQVYIWNLSEISTSGGWIIICLIIDLDWNVFLLIELDKLKINLKLNVWSSFVISKICSESSLMFPADWEVFYLVNLSVAWKTRWNYGESGFLENTSVDFSLTFLLTSSFSFNLCFILFSWIFVATGYNQTTCCWKHGESAQLSVHGGSCAHACCYLHWVLGLWIWCFVLFAQQCSWSSLAVGGGSLICFFPSYHHLARNNHRVTIFFFSLKKRPTVHSVGYSNL